MERSRWVLLLGPFPHAKTMCKLLWSSKNVTKALNVRENEIKNISWSDWEFPLRLWNTGFVSIRPDNSELHNSLKLTCTNIQGLYLNFVDCESFLESNFPDILALCEINLDDSIDSGNFFVRGYLPLIWKDSGTHMHGLAIYVKEGLPLARNLSLENSADSYLCFRLALLHSVSYFFFLYWSPSSALCMVFDSISSNIDEVLSINPSANVFIFGDFSIHHKDWLCILYFFCASFLVTPSLVVAVQPCMEWIPIKKKNQFSCGNDVI